MEKLLEYLRLVPAYIADLLALVSHPKSFVCKCGRAHTGCWVYAGNDVSLTRLRFLFQRVRGDDSVRRVWRRAYLLQILTAVNKDTSTIRF